MYVVDKYVQMAYIFLQIHVEDMITIGYVKYLISSLYLKRFAESVTADIQRSSRLPCGLLHLLAQLALRR